MSALIGAARWNTRLADYVSVLAPSSDGSVVFAGGLSGEALLLDADTGDTIEKLTEHPFGVLSAAWSTDGRTLAVGGHDKVVRLYRYEPAERHIEPVAEIAVDGWVAQVAWSPTDDIVGVGAGRRLTLADSNGTERQRFEPVDSTITAVTWSADGQRVGAAAYGAVSWYAPDDLDATGPKRQHQWKGSILSLELSPDGKWACVGAQDASIHLWKLWSGDALSMSGYPAKIEHLAFRHDSKWMASACLGELTVWDFSKKGPRGTAPASGELHTRHISAMAWLPNGDLLVTGGADGRVVVWPSPRKQRQTLVPLDVSEHTVGVSHVSWRPGTDELFIARVDGLVEVRTIDH